MSSRDNRRQITSSPRGIFLTRDAPYQPTGPLGAGTTAALESNNAIPFRVLRRFEYRPDYTTVRESIYSGDYSPHTQGPDDPYCWALLEQCSGSINQSKRPIFNLARPAPLGAGLAKLEKT